MNINVTAFWDVDAEVWTVSSEDLVGLFTEAPTLDQLAVRISEAALDLLAVQNELDTKQVNRVNFDVECDFLRSLSTDTYNQVSFNIHDSSFADAV